jgi:hypothetical protein
MRAEKVELSWDEKKSEWLVRIQSGEEVIRRYCRLPKNADEQALRSAAQSTLTDEGYEVDGTAVNIAR